MTTVSSKRMHRDVAEPPMSVLKGSTLIDDMEVIRKVCLPGRQDPSLRNVSHFSNGLGNRELPNSTTQDTYTNLGHTEDTKHIRDARCAYMREKHFDLGYNQDPLTSENRSRFVPHGRQRSAFLTHSCTLLQCRGHLLLSVFIYGVRLFCLRSAGGTLLLCTNFLA